MGDVPAAKKPSDVVGATPESADRDKSTGLDGAGGGERDQVRRLPHRYRRMHDLAVEARRRRAERGQ